MANIMTVRATDELRENLKDQARERGLTRNALILQILWEWVERKEADDEERKAKAARQGN